MPYADSEAAKQYSREYNKDWYSRNKEKRKKQIRESNIVQIERQRDAIQHLKEASPCMDCGNKYGYWIMDFDHVRGNKRTEVSKLTRSAYSMKFIMDEIEKCDLVCANCHRDRTHKRRLAGLAQ